MTANVDAVIAALYAVLYEAEQREDEYRWKTNTINRWINQLPGAWAWRWRHLKIRGNEDRTVLRTEAIGHLRATIAYLEINREEVAKPWSLWRRKVSQPKSAEPGQLMIEGPNPERDAVIEES